MIRHCAPAASVAGETGQVSAVIAKSPGSAPPKAMLVMLSGVAPVLVSVTVFAGLVVPTGSLPKFSLAGVNSTNVPEPETVTVCVWPPPLSLTDIDPVAAPAAAGVNVAEMVQVAPAASVAGEIGQVLVWAKPVPLEVMLVIVRVVLPVLASVTVFAGLVAPTSTSPKFSRVGVRLTTVPVPVRETVCGLFGALSVTVIAPVRSPGFVGSNVTLIVHDAFTVITGEQVLV